MALSSEETVLDVGSGLGQFTRDIARAVAPGGRVIGVECDKQQLTEARRQARDAGEAASQRESEGSATVSAGPVAAGSTTVASGNFLTRR